MSTRTPLRAAAFLEQMLLVGFLIHVAASLSMVLFLLPGMPGGREADAAARAGYVAGHPWLWRLGWLPWQITAGVDLLISIAFLRTAWVPRLPAVLGLMVTLAAIVPDQNAEWRWVTVGITAAGDAVRSGNAAPYAAFEDRAMLGVGGYAGVLYTLMGVAWSWCLASAGTWNRVLTVVSAAAWLVLGASAAILFLPPAARPGPVLVSLGNALGFALLLPWFALAAEAVLRRCRGDEPHGRQAAWRHPRWPLLDLLGNSRFLRALGEWLPTAAFISDIRDVIYMNYLVDASRLEALLPRGLELQRLGPDGRHAMVSILTYNHGHFGPALLGPLRRWLPSPVQSNWRLYVRDPRTGTKGVYFFTNAIDRTPHAFGARMLSEGMPMHVPAAAAVEAEKDGSFVVRLTPGRGSAPDLEARLRPSGDRSLPPPASACFDDYHAMLAYTVPQDRAFSSQPWRGRITRQEIVLGIPLEACEPLVGEVYSNAAAEQVGDARPICFRVGRVNFRFDREEYD
jgi:uncharacterized protein YqjF (DUF2071 family)